MQTIREILIMRETVVASIMFVAVITNAFLTPYSFTSAAKVAIYEYRALRKMMKTIIYLGQEQARNS